MGKKSKKNVGADIWDDEDLAPAQGEEFGVNPDEESPKTSEEAGSANGEEEPEEASNDFLNSIRKSKKAKEQKEEELKKDGPKILSKKEKEKLKKEAEKQKKKEAAAKKKVQQAEKKEQIKEANKQNAAAAAKDSKDTTSQNGSEVDDESAEVTKKAPAKKGKKVPAGIAALKRQLELKKQLEDEQRRLEEEEEQMRIEEEKRAQEEEARKEELRAAKKEKERLKKEQLKAEGKLLTKKQKEQKRLQDLRREQLLQASNIKILGLENKDKDAPTEKKKVVYGKKKSTKPKSFLEKKVQPKEPEKTNDDEEEDVLDDWEKLAEDDEDVADDWEAEAEDVKADSSKTEFDEEVEKEEREKKLKEEAEKRAEEEEIARRAKAAAVKAARDAEAAEEAKKKELSRKSAEKEMRSPICCILGHVDTGKTKLLDKVRQTNVQGGEAGGITQQIGATYFPIDAIKQKTAVMSQYEKQTYDVPGLLIIDTPGHESFTNLRSRGSNLCNIAILVIDIMHGLEQQTLESIRLLRDRKAPFVVALNKIDRLYDWKPYPNSSFRSSFEKQGKSVQAEFWNRYEQIHVALAEQGLNSELYFQNKNMSKYVSIVPTSAVTGEGVPDLLWLLLELTQKRMSKQLMYLSQVEATILEVKVVEGFGYTIDVVLSNGILREGDRVVLCGLNGPIATNIRALLTPPPSRELRIKSEYIHHKEVKAALGVKIAANDLEKAVAGSRLIVVGEDDDEEEIMEEVMEDLTGLLDSVDTSGRGVVVQASTLGSLEALLDFLKDMKIPVMSIGLGPVFKRDVMKATTMLEKAPEYAVMLCFDVKIDKEAEQYAEEQNIKIFNADIIYHLFDAFSAYQQKLLEKRRKEVQEYAILPCVLKTIQIINKRNPMIIGVEVIEGTVKIGTPICAVRKDSAGHPNVMVLGRVVSLEVNHKSMDSIKKGQTSQGAAMRLENPSSAQPTWGRHVDESDNLYSLISRKSIDTLKDPAFRDTVAKEDWLLLKKLKPIFDIK